MIVEGQVHGGLAQGIGQALLESCVYDNDSGQLLTGSYMDYCMPRADNLPSFPVATHVTLCTHNPLGVKGCGEAGAIGSPAAVINAVVDALAPLGVADIDMPATPRAGLAGDPRTAHAAKQRNKGAKPCTISTTRSRAASPMPRRRSAAPRTAS